MFGCSIEGLLGQNSATCIKKFDANAVGVNPLAYPADDVIDAVIDTYIEGDVRGNRDVKWNCSSKTCLNVRKLSNAALVIDHACI